MVRVSIPFRARSISSAVGPEARNASISSLIAFSKIFGLHAGAGSGLNLKHGVERQRLLVRLHVQRELFFVDELLVEAAGFSSAQSASAAMSASASPGLKIGDVSQAR